MHLSYYSDSDGNYSIEIKGADHRGRWSHNTIIVPMTRCLSVAEPLIMAMSDEALLSTETSTVDKSDQRIVLIVEDNPDVVHYLTRCLKDSYALEIAMDGQEGIDKALATVPHMIVSDVMMPIRDGFDLCETLKADERTSHIPNYPTHCQGRYGVSHRRANPRCWWSDLLSRHSK